MNIFEEFKVQATRWRDRLAMEHQMSDGALRAFTYQDTLRQVENFAQILEQAGICPGDRVAIACEACPEWNIAYLAIEKLCATAVLLDASLPRPELARLLEFGEVRALFASSSVLKKLEGTPQTAHIPVLDPMHGAARIAGTAQAGRPTTPGDAGVATIIFSSGTTRTASGIMHGHDQLIRTAYSTIKANKLGHKDRYLGILPNSHIYGLICQLFGPLMAGASVRFLESLSAPSIVKAFEEYRPTVLPGVPKVYELLEAQVKRKVEADPKTQKLFAKLFPICMKLRQKTGINLGKLLFRPIHQALGGCLRVLSAGGAPMRQETAEFYFGTGFHIMITYGSTEANIPVFGNYGRNITTDSCGKPYPGIKIAFSDSGELLIRSPYQMLGYFKDEQATKDAFDQDGWLLSGDLGELDKRGNVRINGRRKENIVLATGKKVTPDDIESSYTGIAGMKDFAVCGVPVQGEGYDEIHAFTVPEPGKMQAVLELLRCKSAEMAHHMQLTKIHIVDEIPRTALQKPKRYLLRKLAQAQEQNAKPAAALQQLPQQKPASISSIVYDSVARMAGVPRESLRPETRLFIDLPIDSLGAIDLALELEEACQVPLGHLLKNDSTLGQLLEWASGSVPQTEAGSAHSAHPLDGYPKSKKPKDYALFHMVQQLFGRIYRINIQNESVLPQDKGYIICSNHVSNFDFLYLTLHFEKERFLKFCCMAKKELFQKGYLSRRLARICGMIPVDRGGMVMDAMTSIKEKLQERWGVLIHPEGTRSRDGLIHHFKKGAAILAIEAGVPIIPAYIKGGYEVYPRWKKLPRIFNWKKLGKFQVEVIYGEPIFPTGLTPEELIQMVEQAVQMLSVTVAVG